MPFSFSLFSSILLFCLFFSRLYDKSPRNSFFETNNPFVTRSVWLFYMWRGCFVWKTVPSSSRCRPPPPHFVNTFLRLQRRPSLSSSSFSPVVVSDPLLPLSSSFVGVGPPIYRSLPQLEELIVPSLSAIGYSLVDAGPPGPPPHIKSDSTVLSG